MCVTWIDSTFNITVYACTHPPTQIHTHTNTHTHTHTHTHSMADQLDINVDSSVKAGLHFCKAVAQVCIHMLDDGAAFSAAVMIRFTTQFSCFISSTNVQVLTPLVPLIQRRL